MMFLRNVSTDIPTARSHNLEYISVHLPFSGNLSIHTSRILLFSPALFSQHGCHVLTGVPIQLSILCFLSSELLKVCEYVYLGFKCKNLKKKQHDGWTDNSSAIRLNDNSLQLDVKHGLCQVKIAGLAKLWPPCLEWHAAFTSVPVFFYSFASLASLYCEDHVYTYTYLSA